LLDPAAFWSAGALLPLLRWERWLSNVDLGDVAATVKAAMNRRTPNVGMPTIKVIL